MECGEGVGKRRIKLFCPTASKLLQIVAVDEQKLDLGWIARAFGLDPSALKLNGHFISRGVDLVASSVTWKSLIGFFSARGLSTGVTDCDALVVDGKLSKIGSERSHEVGDALNGVLDLSRKEPFGVYKRKQCGHCSLLNNGSNSGEVYSKKQTTLSNGFGLKRNLLLEDGSNAKRTKCDEAFSGCQERRRNASSGTLSSCSFISKTMKRIRSDDEMVATSPLKKNRILEPP